MDNQNTQPQQVPQEPVMTPAPARSNILIVVLVGLLMLGIGLGGGYFLFANKTQEMPQQNEQTTQVSPTVAQVIPSINPTTNQEMEWKNYTNEQLGVSFIYPASYILKKDTSSEVVFTTMIGPEHLQTEVRELVVTSIITKPESVNPEKKDNSKKATFAGKSVIKFAGCCGDPGIDYIQTTNEPRLEIQFITHGGGGFREKIESSFKFTK